MARLYPGSLLLGLVMALHGLRKGSLSLSGSIAAVTVAYASMANPLRAFGIMLIAFYLAGSRATKVKAGVKARLETEMGVSEEEGQEKTKGGGKRDAWQVLCNSFTAAVAAVLFRLLFSSTTPLASRFLSPPAPSGPLSSVSALFSAHSASQMAWQNGWAWCALDARSHQGLPRALILIALGHYACCMGDTLASELGILSSAKPVLVTSPARTVPPGTNGGISAFGTFCSLLGGIFIGLVCLVSIWTGNPACQKLSVEQWRAVVFLGGGAGIGGSMIDSLLGATCQRTWYNPRTKRILIGRLPSATSVGAKANGNGQAIKKRDAEAEGWEIVCGSDLLTNNQVNFISSLVTAGMTALVGHSIF